MNEPVFMFFLKVPCLLLLFSHVFLTSHKLRVLHQLFTDDSDVSFIHLHL